MAQLFAMHYKGTYLRVSSIFVINIEINGFKRKDR